MINIRPVSDLRNKYPEIEELVLKDDKPVYLTKNGYGSMVVMSLEKYSNLINSFNEAILDARFGCEDIEKELKEAQKEFNDINTKFYTHEEMKKLAEEVLG